MTLAVEEAPPYYAIVHDGPAPDDPDAPRRGRQHWDHDAEAGIIGALLAVPRDERATIATSVTLDDFTLHRNRTIWNVVDQLVAHDGPLTPAVLADALGPDLATVTHHAIQALYQQASGLNWTSWASILRRHTHTRQALAAASELHHAISTDGDWTPAVARLEELRTGALDASPYHFTVVPYGDTETIEPPAFLTCTDGKALIYPGRHHDVHGEPGDGKSWIGLAAARDVLHQGHAVVWVDWEDTRAAFDARMLALGVPDEDLADPARVAFIRPDGAWNDTDRHGLHELAKHLDARFVCFDAMTDALTMEGRNENDPADVNSWLTATCKPLNRLGVATLIIDHVPKSTENRPRGARGSGDKLGVIDGVSYALKLTRAYSKETAGEVRLIVVKDRHGFVAPRGTAVARITIEPHDGGRQVDLTVHHHHEATDDAGQFLPTALMDRISRFLEARPGEELSGRRILDAVKGKTDYKRAALDRLVELGHISESPGPRGATLYSILDPYREPVETDTEAGADDTTAPRAPTAPPPRPGSSRVDRAPAPPPRRGRARSTGAVDTPETSPPRPTDDEPFPYDEEPW